MRALIFYPFLFLLCPAIAWAQDSQAPEQAPSSEPERSLWYDIRQIHEGKRLSENYIELNFFGNVADSGRQGDLPPLYTRNFGGEVMWRPWGFGFDTPFRDSEPNDVSFGPYLRFSTGKHRTDDHRWYESELVVGAQTALVHYNGREPGWSVTFNTSLVFERRWGKASGSNATYELFYQNSVAFEASFRWEYYDFFIPVGDQADGQRTGFVPVIRFEMGIVEHIDETINSTLVRGSGNDRADEPDSLNYVWLRADAYVVQLAFEDVSVAIGGFFAGDEPRADKFRHRTERHGDKVRLFRGGLMLRVVLLRTMSFEAEGWYGQYQKLDQELAGVMANVRMLF